MGIKIAGGMILTLLIFVGCGTTPSDVAIEATVEAKVQATMEARTRPDIVDSTPVPPTSIPVPLTSTPISTPVPPTSTPISTPVPPTSTATAIPAQTIKRYEAAEIVNLAKPSIAFIECQLPNGNISSGTGIIYSEQGLLLTNYHVVADATTIEVLVTDNTGYEKVVAAELLGADAEVDLAVLKIQEGIYIPAEFPKSGDVELGELVIALGYPLADITGISLSVTSGIVSSVRNDGDRKIIQHQASINPGNSGGPLYNQEGKVVGINTYVMRQSEGMGIEGFNIAIAIEEAISRIKELEKPGLVETIKSKQYSNEKYNFAFDIPKEWSVIYSDDNTGTFYNTYFGSHFSFTFDPTAGDFISGEDWADYWHEIAMEGLENYQLLEYEYEEESGSRFYGYIYSFTLDYVEYMEMSALEYRLDRPDREWDSYPGGFRRYLQIPTDYYDEALPSALEIIQLFDDALATSLLSDYITVEDDEGIFSISIPAHWEYIEQDANETPGYDYKLFVGQPYPGAGYIPNIQIFIIENVNLVFQSSTTEGMLKEIVEHNIGIEHATILDSGQYSLGGIDTDYVVVDTPEVGFYQVLFREKGEVWGLLCSLFPSHHEDYFDIAVSCNNVIDSFRFL